MALNSLLPSCLPMVHAPTQELGFISSPYATSHSKSQAHTMDGIVLGRFPTSNAILVYNPRNQHYYEPNSYKIDP